MENFVNRLGEEKLNLHGSMVKLGRFLDSDGFKEVELREQDILKLQHKAMANYYGCLNQRLYRHINGSWADDCDAE